MLIMKNITAYNRYIAWKQHKITSSYLQDDFVFNLDIHSDKENSKKRPLFTKDKVLQPKYEKTKLYSCQPLKKQKQANTYRRNWSQILKIKLGINQEKGNPNLSKKFYPLQHKTNTYQGKSSHSCNPSAKYSKDKNKKANRPVNTIQSSIERVSRSQHLTINFQQLHKDKRQHNNIIIKFPVFNLYRKANTPVYTISRDNINNILIKDYNSEIGMAIKQKISLESSIFEVTKQQSPELLTPKVNLIEAKQMKTNFRETKDNPERPLQKRKIQSVHRCHKQTSFAKKQKKQQEIQIKPWSFGQIPIDQ